MIWKLLRWTTHTQKQREKRETHVHTNTYLCIYIRIYKYLYEIIQNDLPLFWASTRTRGTLLVLGEHGERRASNRMTSLASGLSGRGWVEIGGPFIRGQGWGRFASTRQVAAIRYAHRVSLSRYYETYLLTLQFQFQFSISIFVTIAIFASSYKCNFAFSYNCNFCFLLQVQFWF